MSRSTTAVLESLSIIYPKSRCSPLFHICLDIDPLFSYFWNTLEQQKEQVMISRDYSASIQKDLGRSSWCLIFRHPLRPKKDGSMGLRIRRGLGTTDELEANRLKDQLNVLLSDHSFHNIAAKDRAEKQFDGRIVSAFFDNLTPTIRDSWAERESNIHFPGPKDGYARLLLVGTTGSGKTTLVRQLIGSSPNADRFPSISPAKTTIADIEIITAAADQPYCGTVTFIDQDKVRQYIEECIVAAVIAYYENQNEKEAQRRFLIHTEQRFRLSYLLGTFASSVNPVDADLFDEDDDDSEFDVEATDLTTDEREVLQKKLQSYLRRIVTLSRHLLDETPNLYQRLNINALKPSKEDIDRVSEQIEELLFELEDLHSLADDVMVDVESRFSYLNPEHLVKNKSGWPVTWYFESHDRKEFLHLVNTFSSNYAPRFGRLLTPLVDGIRVRGPFIPSWSEDQPLLAIMDGEGLGHTPDSSSSISTSITRKFQHAEAIILVDNAKQPMQGGSLAVLSSLASRGYESKLILCFTHFDQVKGDNLPTMEERRSQVLASVDNAVAAVGSKLDDSITRALRRILPDRTVILSKIHETLSPKSGGTKAQLQKILEIASDLIAPTEPSLAHPIYTDANLVLVVQKALKQFHDRWQAKLGIRYDSSHPPEHWSRVKALTRRLGLWKQDQYEDLRPIADLIQYMVNAFNVFISKPQRWADTPDEIAQQQSKSAIKQAFDRRIDEFVTDLLLESNLSDWSKAYYDYNGIGSAYKRARKIDDIYRRSLPIPGEFSSIELNDFLDEFRVVVRESISEGGGHIHMLENNVP